MPLYLVRWPGMQASLVNARDERDLVNILDQVASPAACTWVEYEGSLWIDVGLNVDVKVKGDMAAATAETVELGSLEPLSERALRLDVPGVDEDEMMEHHVGEWAFPNVHEELARQFEDSFDRDDPVRLGDSNALKRAIAADLVEHARRTAARTVEIDENGVLSPAELWHFRRTTKGGFVLVEPISVANFIHGAGKLPAGKDGLVRLVTVTASMRDGEPVAVTPAKEGVALRVDESGVVIPAHRAGAYDTEDPGDPSMPLLLHRNRAVRWELSAAEQEKLAEAAEKEVSRYDSFSEDDIPF